MPRAGQCQGAPLQNESDDFPCSLATTAFETGWKLVLPGTCRYGMEVMPRAMAYLVRPATV